MKNLNELSNSANDLLLIATRIAEGCDMTEVHLEHLLTALTVVDSPAKDCLATEGVTFNYLNGMFFNDKVKLDNVIKIDITTLSAGFGVCMDDATLKCIRNAIKTTYEFGDSVYPEDILVELLKSNNEKISIVLHGNLLNIPKTIKQLLSYRVFRDSAAKDLKNYENKKTMKNKKKKSGPNLSVLMNYGINLVEEAKCGRLDLVYGRDSETERLIEILGRKRKNNPCLVGDAGVGKTAIVEGLAHRIATGNVPKFLKNSMLISLDMGLLLSGTKYRGEFESRLESIIQEVQKHPNIILFLDEIHNIVNCGNTEGSIDAGNILKPYLARGVIKCIGSTTNNEYRKYIEKDGALERRFQKISVDEPTEEVCIEILRESRASYEKHHGVSITDEAIISSVELSSRYIGDRFLPDKAFDLLDEACSKVKIANVKSSVTKKDIVNILYQWTGIPTEDLSVEKVSKVLSLKNKLSKKIVGQDNAINAVSNAIIRSQAGLRDEDRPIASFIFSGPTGVGKTELARVLSSSMFGNEKSLIRIDMSEYMEKQSISKLIGSAPGYVGYKEGGQLTEIVRKKPYSVVLFDEIEKAHPDVINIFLQILDDGRLTDGQGKTVDFKNTIIIFTSNLYNPYDSKSNPIGFEKTNSDEESSKYRDKALSSFSSTFSPEFVNRLDDIIVFNRLNEDAMLSVLNLLIKQIKLKLNKKGIKLVVTKKSKAFLLSQCVDNKYGARPLKRILSKYIEDELSVMLLTRSIKEGDIVKVTCVSKSLNFKVEKVDNKEVVTV